MRTPNERIADAPDAVLLLPGILFSGRQNFRRNIFRKEMHFA